MTRALIIAALLTACSPDPYCADLVARIADDDARLAREVEDLRREIRRGVVRTGGE